MRYAEDHKEKSRIRILSAATSALRNGGPTEVGVAEIMAKAGLTHGAFYAHFKSKDALVSAAVSEGTEQSRRRIRAHLAGRSPEEGLKALIEAYLSIGHRDGRAEGCLLPALCSDMPRLSKGIRGDFDGAFLDLSNSIEILLVAMKRSEPARLARSLVAEMVGGVALARAVSSAKLSQQILADVKLAVKRRAGLKD